MSEIAIPRKVLFLTGTRADFGKVKSLIAAVEAEKALTAYVFVTGMHMMPQYGSTWDEVRKCGFKNIFTFINQKTNDSMDMILSNTISGLSNYILLERPDMIVVHGDRVEALAGAIVGALNNILVAHIEGGEVSGTIDESIRHSVSKLSHIHFVSNETAKKRLIQMGESKKHIYVIGSPDIDLMRSKSLPSLRSVKDYYEIPFLKYAILLYHPVTTSVSDLCHYTQELVEAVIASKRNYVVINPNNDLGSEIILDGYKKLSDASRFRIFPSIRFEAFLVLLKKCEFIIGNSSAGIREAPFYSVPTINIGIRQKGRFSHESIKNCGESKAEILKAISEITSVVCRKCKQFGDGRSTERFIKALRNPKTWIIDLQKYFLDID
ncbi:MAG: UDP-N-acetylglucosamine 2-epimerase (hydrolyzing) [Candidatus Latescibacteria bacterium]|nr:UDP-N-acetylglucosamine 2-epimerase (hydrolyzing) [Candidatus Latescibacterota bacterium]